MILTGFLVLSILAIAWVAIPRMADLNVATLPANFPRGGTGSYVVKNATTIYAGSLVGLDANGFLDKWSDTAGHKFIGVLMQDVVGDTSASPPVEGRVDESGVVLKNVAIAGTFVQGSLNDPIYCSSGNTADCTRTAATNVKAVGWAKRFRAAGFGDVQLFTPNEYQCL